MLPTFLARLGPHLLGITALLCLRLESVQFGNEMGSAGGVNIDTASTSFVRWYPNLGVSEEEEEHGKVPYWTSGRAGYLAPDLRSPRHCPCCKAHKFITSYFVWQTRVLGTITRTLQIISPKPSQPMEALKLRLGVWVFFLQKGIGIKLQTLDPDLPPPGCVPPVISQICFILQYSNKKAKHVGRLVKEIKCSQVKSGKQLV